MASSSLQARHGLTALLNYLAGAMIYVRREYSERISLLRVSWIAASTSRHSTPRVSDSLVSGVGQEEEGLPEPSTESMEKFREREEGLEHGMQYAMSGSDTWKSQAGSLSRHLPC